MRLKIAQYARKYGQDEAAEKFNLGKVTVYLMMTQFFGRKRQQKNKKQLLKGEESEEENNESQ